MSRTQARENRQRQLQELDRDLASDDGQISRPAKLVEALKRCIPEGTENAERKKEALRLARELLAELGMKRSDGPQGVRRATEMSVE